MLTLLLACAERGATDTKATADSGGALDTHHTADTADTTDTADNTDSSSEPTDADGDGFPTPDDCDDANPEVHSGAAEVCGNGSDDDCDGSAWSCAYAGVYALDETALAIRSAEAGDFFGYVIDGGYDLTGDGVPDVVVAAESASTIASYAGAAYVLAGPFDADRTLGEDELRVDGTVGDQAVGSDLAILPDIDGDGIAELLVAADDDDDALRIFRGPITGPLRIDDADIQISGQAAGMGRAVDAAGDVDGDGRSDFLASRTYNFTDSDETVHVWSGASARSGTADDATATLAGVAGDRVAGVGDLDGDGLDDVAVTGSTGIRETWLWVFTAPLVGDIDAAAATATLEGGYEDWGLGYGAEGLDGGDVDGDGYADFAVSSQYFVDDDDHQGAAYVVSGPITGDHSLPAVAAAAIYGGASTGFSVTLSIGGDHDGDGRNDLALPAPEFGGAGALALFYGPLSGAHDLINADARFDGPQVGSIFQSVASVGDLDGNGTDDLAVGDVDSTGTEYGPGLVWLLHPPGW